jgi:hypothetical protein
MTASLLKLLNNLHLVADKAFLINQVDVFQSSIIEGKVTDVVIMNFTGFIDYRIARIIQILFGKTPAPSLNTT